MRIFEGEIEMKKLSAVIAAACVMAASALPAFADAAVETYPVACPEGFKGGSLTAAVYADIPDLSGVHLTFKYDRSKLRYKAQTTSIGHGDATDNGTTLEWNSVLDPEGQKVTYSDKIVTIEFEVIGELEKNGKYIEVGCTEAYDGDMNDIDFLGSSKYTIKFAGTTGYKGDVDKDGAVTTSDALTILRTSMLGADSLGAEDKLLYDCNEDTFIDAADALDALRFSAELPVSAKGIGMGISVENTSFSTIKK